MLAVEVSTTGFRKIEPEVIKIGSIIENDSMEVVIPIEKTDYTAYVEADRDTSMIRLVEMDRRDVKEIKITLGRDTDKQGNECSLEDTIIIDLAKAQIKTGDKSESLIEISDRYDIQITCEVGTHTKNGDFRGFEAGTVNNMEEAKVKQIESLMIQVSKRCLDTKVDLMTVYCGSMEGSVVDKVWISADIESEAWQLMNKKA